MKFAIIFAVLTLASSAAFADGDAPTPVGPGAGHGSTCSNVPPTWPIKYPPVNVSCSSAQYPAFLNCAWTCIDWPVSNPSGGGNG
jgi:hypothetical protein